MADDSGGVRDAQEMEVDEEGPVEFEEVTPEGSSDGEPGKEEDSAAAQEEASGVEAAAQEEASGVEAAAQPAPPWASRGNRYIGGKGGSQRAKGGKGKGKGGGKQGGKGGSGMRQPLPAPPAPPAPPPAPSVPWAVDAASRPIPKPPSVPAASSASSSASSAWGPRPPWAPPPAAALPTPPAVPESSSMQPPAPQIVVQQPKQRNLYQRRDGTIVSGADMMAAAVACIVYLFVFWRHCTKNQTTIYLCVRLCVCVFLVCVYSVSYSYRMRGMRLVFGARCLYCFLTQLYSVVLGSVNAPIALAGSTAVMYNVVY